MNFFNSLLPIIEHFIFLGYLITFLAAFLETVIGIGWFLPGSTIILIIGAYAAKGYFNIFYIIFFAIIGAIIGDSINYHIGRKYSQAFRERGFWFLKRSHFEKAKNFFDIHGPKSVFFGRFVPSIKEIIPFIAGSLKMKRKTFFKWNILGAIGWSIELALAGYIFARSLDLAREWLSRIGILVGILLICILVWYILKMRNKMKNFGFILINKPSGITSHDAIDYLRKITKIKKIGHSGTLDPFATGLLICGIDRKATKKLSIFLKQDKEYIADLRLGAITDTYDRDGKVSLTKNVRKPDLIKIKKILKDFIGEVNQIPPIFSAKKFKGKKLYQLARKGIEIKLEPKKVKIYNIKLLSYNFPKMKIKVNCSSGTYIRSLADDIGKELGVGAYLQELCRTKIGKFSLKKAVFLYDLNSENWQNYLT